MLDSRLVPLLSVPLLLAAPVLAQDPAAAGGTHAHPLNRKAPTLDLEGNVVPGAYTMAIDVGTPPQTFEVMVDTGSANLVLLGDRSLCDNCADEIGQSLYSPSKSSTARLGDAELTLQYGSGSLKAREVTDRVQVGSLPAIDYGFSVMTHQAGIHNILGLAYEAEAEPKDKPLKPYFDALVSQTGIADVFSMTLCPNGTSTITLGGSDVEVSETIDLAAETYYVVKPKKMQVKGGKSLGKFSLRAIVDSGTTELMVPARIHAKIMNVLTPIAEKNGVDLSHQLIRTTAEAIAQFPTLQVVIKNSAGETIALDVAPETYFRKIGTVGYMLAIAVTNVDVAILGQVFMENYAVVFDRANRRIGLGSNAGCG